MQSTTAGDDEHGSGSSLAGTEVDHEEARRLNVHDDWVRRASADTTLTKPARVWDRIAMLDRLEHLLIDPAIADT